MNRARIGVALFALIITVGGILAFLVMTVGCTKQIIAPPKIRKSISVKDVLGKWYLVAPEEETQANNPSLLKAVNELVLKADGTFIEHCEMNAIAGGHGTYSVLGNRVTLTGPYPYEGSGKFKTITLEYIDSLLSEPPGDYIRFCFARTNAQTAAEKRKLMGAFKHSDLEAIRVIQQVESTYRSLNTYSDRGTQRSVESDFV